MQSSNSETLLVVFVALTAIALLAQAGLLVVIFLVMKKAVEGLRSDFNELRESAMPVLKQSKVILERIGPSIEPVTADVVKTVSNMRVISGDVAELTKKMRAEAENVQASAADIRQKVKVQSVRIDQMVTRSLVQSAVGGPAKKLAGVLAAAKAIVESLAAKRKATPRTVQGTVAQTPEREPIH
jgi:hypothetical protein